MTAQVVEIVVRGPLWPSVLAALDDFTVDADADGRTTIVGSVADQPQLVGLLDMFGSLNVEIISVNPAPRETMR
ncbi:hypothetical protein GCM10009775_32760 [Microbacterium aoyamense]|uniref:Uncharacterized protein n=1 Tax=Microbacterium aoyamense TaxID=344166 RepID=A0ABP5B9N6_9MICO|nr:hypothetical protein [Microbacterium aoyamense]